MDVNKREFINSSARALGLTGLLASGNVLGALASGNVLGAFSPLEQAALPSRKVIGTFNDVFNDLGVVEMYSNGMVLTQRVNLTDDYSAEVLYFVRDGKTKEGEWSVRCDLYKKGTPAAVNSMLVEGSAESGKLAISNMTKQAPKATWIISTSSSDLLRMMH